MARRPTTSTDPAPDAPPEDAVDVTEAPAEDPAEEAAVIDVAPVVTEAPAEDPAEEAAVIDVAPVAAEAPAEDPAEEAAVIDVAPVAAEAPAEDPAEEAAVIDVAPVAAEEDAPHVSNNVLDEPEVERIATLADTDPALGVFVAFGVEHMSRDGREWAVDPETGLIVAEVTGAAVEPTK